MLRREFTESFVLWLVTLWFAGTLPGQEIGAEKSLANQLLSDVWENTPRNRTAAQKMWDEADAGLRSDLAAQWAYALNRIQHRRYRDAKPLVDQVAESQPTHWDARYAQVWMAAFVDHFDQALELMKKAKADLDAAAGVDPKQVDELYFRLGRIYGYLEGPYGARVQRAALDETYNILSDGAPESALNAFVAERNSVLDQYQSLMAQKGQKEQTRFDELLRQQQVELEQQSQLAARMEQQSTESRASRDSVVREGQAEVNRTKSELDALTAEFNRQQSLVSSARYDLDNVWLSIANIDHLLAHESDPVIRTQLYLDRNFYLSQVREKEFYLNNLLANANSLYSQMGSAAATYDQTVATYQGRVQAVDQDIATAEQTLNNANRKIRKLQADPKVSNTLVATIEATATALTSYDPFPAELLRQRELDRLKAAQ